MTNREQVAWAFQFGDYDNRQVAEIVKDMLFAVGGTLFFDEQCNLEEWLGLQCDSDNNWGVLEED